MTCSGSGEEFIYSDYDHGKRVIYGHTPGRKPLVQPNKIGIDTGAVVRRVSDLPGNPGLDFSLRLTRPAGAFSVAGHGATTLPRPFPVKYGYDRCF